MVRRIACVGGGPGGLFCATLIKQAMPEVAVTVFERNRAEDTFGFGVVFSDATLDAIHQADPVLLEGLRDHGAHWDEIEVRLKGQVLRCAGNGMAAIDRKKLLQLLQDRAAEVGVDLRFQHAITGLTELDGYDLVVAADGANSRLREELADAVAPSVEVADAKFIWFGTPYQFRGLTFVHERSQHGAFAVHGYPISDTVSTFIVETDERTWRAAGLDEFDTSQPPGISDTKTKDYLEKLFAHQIDGRPLLTNNSRWGNFRTRRARSWHHGNVVLLGDAAHTAHFSVGSGTKMAMEDAVALAAALRRTPDDVAGALQRYERDRMPGVAKIQDSARPSLSWWERFGRYHESFDPTRFTFHFLTRSIGRSRLAGRDPEFVADVERAWRAEHDGHDVLDTPLELGDTRLPGRFLTDDPGVHLTTDPLQPRAATAPWGLWLAAPEDESGLPAAYDELAGRAEHGPALVAVHAGSALTRTLLSEQARLVHGIPTLVIEPDADADRAATLVLSGRADAVAPAQAVVR
ncbi:anthraniloyl-CoA monooxygenase [Haloechinothrix alba]|uniref:Anthraniloyl-CoA monooxygenase n=1 Tax=Haloechinothrix alba TaxID=664784 RepID=A0A238YVD0_9PSEU|nr:anthraniloyl-CoA monooxygenase [Haloechinothrix alba]